MCIFYGMLSLPLCVYMYIMYQVPPFLFFSLGTDGMSAFVLCTVAFQEAFKAIEEIHNLLELSGKTPRAGLLDNYYSRQVKVYWMANNKLFHAAALHKLFVLWKEQKKSIMPEELLRLTDNHM